MSKICQHFGENEETDQVLLKHLDDAVYLDGHDFNCKLNIWIDFIPEAPT